MLVDAMWYGIVPEEKTGQGFTFGFLTLTPAEAFIGSMVHIHISHWRQSGIKSTSATSGI